MIPESRKLWSLGHSNLELAQFLELLRAHALERVVDVRRYPVSRRLPHFTRDALALALPRAGVHYVHVAELGGHREAGPDSAHTALPPGPFRGYAEHMATAAFRGALAYVVARARERRTAVMCAEARFGDCHRSLLCDRLVADGCAVVHVRRDAPDELHRLSTAARLEDGALVYRGAQRLLFG